MSVIGNNHSIVPFTKDSKAYEAQRLARISFKTGKDGSKASESKCISLPILEAKDCDIQALMPYITDMVQDAQDSIVRKLILAGKTSVASEQVNAAAVLAELAAQAQSKRLTSEMVIEWFSSSGLEDALMMQLARKFGVSETPTDDEVKLIGQRIKTYKDKFASLSSGAASCTPEVCDKLLVVLKLAPEGDAMAAKFKARLEAMKRKSDEDFEALDL